MSISHVSAMQQITKIFTLCQHQRLVGEIVNFNAKKVAKLAQLFQRKLRIQAMSNVTNKRGRGSCNKNIININQDINCVRNLVSARCVEVYQTTVTELA